MSIFLVAISNAVVFSLYCYLVSQIILQKKDIKIKDVLLAFIPFLIMYYCILCLFESIYATFFSGLCAFFFIRIIFKENIFMSLFISLVICTLKSISKILILILINNNDLLLINTYKTLDWNAFYVDLYAILPVVFLIYVFRKQFRKLVKKVSSLTNRRLVLLIATYISFIIVLIFQHPSDLFSISVITDFLMIFVLTFIGIFGISSEMKIESLSNHYQEIFKYSKANGELLAHYKMQVHENKNRLIMIKQMLNGPKSEIKKYIDCLINETTNNKSINDYWLSELRYISLAGVRNFINYKLNRLTELGAQIEVFVSSDLENIDASLINEKEYNQLTIILGVILDNMIDAIKETDEKLISINIYVDDNKIQCDFVNTYSGEIDLKRLHEVGYTTKGEKHGIGLSLVAKITKMNPRFECNPRLIDNFFVQHFTIKILNQKNLQKLSEK